MSQLSAYLMNGGYSNKGPYSGVYLAPEKRPQGETGAAEPPLSSARSTSFQ